MRELDRRDRQAARRIPAFVHGCVVVRGDSRSIGQTLEGSELGEFWMYRIGDDLVVADIREQLLRVLVVRVRECEDTQRRQACCCRI